MDFQHNLGDSLGDLKNAGRSRNTASIVPRSVPPARPTCFIYLTLQDFQLGLTGYLGNVVSAVLFH